FQVDADGLLSVSAREKTTGIGASVVVKPSYGLTDDEVATMLREGFDHAQADRDARALAEQRVEAEGLITAIRSAIAHDGDLLSSVERASLEAGLASLDVARQGTDHRALKSAIEALNRASESFAGRRMDRSVSRALAGRRVDEVSAK
ncbi:MAG TPA: Hsp70 family protein, partial [Usitatibacteraceae bacterium]|nr:Hsp70 family protein [Usitatibacteraceae bacterium]